MMQALRTIDVVSFLSLKAFKKSLVEVTIMGALYARQIEVDTMRTFITPRLSNGSF